MSWTDIKAEDQGILATPKRLPVLNIYKDFFEKEASDLTWVKSQDFWNNSSEMYFVVCVFIPFVDLYIF